MTIKLVAIDIDGTLLDDHQQIPAKNVQAIQAADAAGVQIVLATGRPLAGVTDYLKQLGLWSKHHYTITFNGALVQENVTDKVISEYTLALSTFQTFARLAHDLGVHIHGEDKNDIYTPNRDISPYTVIESALVKLPLHYRRMNEFPEDMRFSKLMIVDKPDLISKITPLVPKQLRQDYYIVNSEPFFLEVMNKATSKGKALKQLAGQLGFTANEVMAIGDQGNDLSMLKYAGQAVAMANGSKIVKAAANIQTLSNNDGGVGYAIEKYVLK